MHTNSAPPPPNTSHLETRLLIVAEMLERAVAEVHRAMAEMKSSAAAPAQVVDPAPEAPKEMEGKDEQQ